MSAADRERWDSRYQDVPVDPQPKDVLVDAAHWLGPGGRALDLACGQGQAAVWLAERGFEVDAVDISPVGLAALDRLAAERGVTDRIRAIEADLDDGVPTSGPYDVVVCLHFRSARLAEVIASRLRPGGLIVASRLSVVGREPAADGPDPRFLAVPGELLEVAAGCEVLLHAEADGQALLVARKPLIG